MEALAVSQDEAANPDGEASGYAIGELLLIAPLRQQSTGYYAAKRAMDVVGAALLLIVLAPLFVLVAISILVDSGRPVFYTQQRLRARRIRVGVDWVWRLETFTLCKFRTMYKGVPATSHEEYIEAYINGDQEILGRLGGERAASSGTYKLLEDPRVTPVGRVLRALSLDELPQLYNVLVGDMSLVGPRPPIPYEVAAYRPGDMARFAAAPGLTGAWQVGGRCNLSFDEMISLDTDYIQRQSIGLDLKLLFKTVPAVLTGKGAG